MSSKTAGRNLDLQNSINTLDIGHLVRTKGEHCLKCGGFGDVWEGEMRVEGTNEREDNEQRKFQRVAVKVLRTALLEVKVTTPSGPVSAPSSSSVVKKHLLSQGSIWKLLHHPNVCKFYGLAFAESGTVGSPPDSEFGGVSAGSVVPLRGPAIVMEFCEFGNVMEYLEAMNHRRSGEQGRGRRHTTDDEESGPGFDGNEADGEFVGVDERLDIIRQVSHGLKYLHDRDIIHGDIRGCNILIKSDHTPSLTDYGLVHIFDDAELTMTRYNVAAVARWIAPEVLDPTNGVPRRSSFENRWETVQAVTVEDSPPKSPYTKSSDVYSFAMTCVQILTGKPPLPTYTDTATIIGVLSQSLRPAVPHPFLGDEKSTVFLKRCWEGELAKRPDIGEVTTFLDGFVAERMEGKRAPEPDTVGSGVKDAQTQTLVTDQASPDARVEYEAATAVENGAASGSSGLGWISWLYDRLQSIIPF